MGAAASLFFGSKSCLWLQYLGVQHTTEEELSTIRPLNLLDENLHQGGVIETNSSQKLQWVLRLNPMSLGESLSFQSYLLEEGIHRNPDVCMQISLSEEINEKKETSLAFSSLTLFFYPPTIT